MRRSKHDAEQTRCAILDAAELIFSQDGVASATLERISRAAGVTRGAFYWHFTDKIDLLRALRERSASDQERLVRSAAEQGHDDPLGLLEQTACDMLLAFETDERQQRMFAIMTSHLPDAAGTAWLEEVNVDMFRTIAALTAQAGRLRMLDAAFTPDEAAVVLMATIRGLLAEWLGAGRKFPLHGLGSRLLHKQMSFLRASPT